MDFESLFRPGILATRPYAPGKPIAEVKRELGLSEVIKLASNENPEGPLPAVVEAIVKAIPEINRYPDASCYELNLKLADFLGVKPANLIFGNGSNEVIDIIIRALISPGENVVFSAHSFIVYQLTTAVHFECGRPVPLAAGDKHDLPGMAAAVDDKTKLVIICNPNNPTGTYNTAAEFSRFLERIPDHVMVAVDEAYYEYVMAEDFPQTLGMLAEHPNLVILRTFSKIHSLAGMRIGYGIAHEDFIGQLHKTREPFNVNALSQVAALACIEHWDEVAGRAARNRQQLDWLCAELSALGLDVVPSQTNFVLVRVQGKAGEFTRQLLARGVIVRPMDAFGLGEGAMRISVGLPHENRKCVQALKEIVGR